MHYAYVYVLYFVYSYTTLQTHWGRGLLLAHLTMGPMSWLYCRCFFFFFPSFFLSFPFFSLYFFLYISPLFSYLLSFFIFSFLLEQPWVIKEVRSTTVYSSISCICVLPKVCTK
ncbi:hypothetical protein F4823DRAFT_136682 [Ustulina deusta]|nr:hypothetical protein F4823DRAFT_136682 [Ustulina deusta]